MHVGRVAAEVCKHVADSETKSIENGNMKHYDGWSFGCWAVINPIQKLCFWFVYFFDSGIFVDSHAGEVVAN